MSARRKQLIALSVVLVCVVGMAVYGIVRVSNKTADKGSGFDVAMTDTMDKSRKEAKDSDQAEKKEKTDQKTDTKKEEPAKEDQKEETLPTLDLTKNQAKKSVQKKSHNSTQGSSSYSNTGSGNTTSNTGNTGSNSSSKPNNSGSNAGNNGGSLRIDNTDPLVKTNMRLGYDFKIPSDTTFKGCEWYYGTASDNLSLKLAPTTTKYITNPGGKGNDVYRSNIVFTNMPKSAYKKNACARVLVKYGDGEHTYSKMGLGIDTRTVYEVAKAVKDDLETHENATGNTYEYVKKLVEAADVQ